RARVEAAAAVRSAHRGAGHARGRARAEERRAQARRDRLATPPPRGDERLDLVEDGLGELALGDVPQLARDLAARRREERRARPLGAEVRGRVQDDRIEALPRELRARVGESLLAGHRFEGEAEDDLPRLLGGAERGDDVRVRDELEHERVAALLLDLAV